MIKHVSFDVWNTLISPNPQFAENRTKFIALALNMDEAHVKRCYTTVKSIADGNAENEGVAFTTDELYNLLYKSMGLTVAPSLHREIRATVEVLFRLYPPTVGTNVRELMTWLRNAGITVGIGSNSNFISGTVMRPFLEEALDQQFIAAVFSDLIDCAKPNPRFFSTAMFRINTERYVPIKKEEVLHVGDNVTCDVSGAAFVGMHGLLISSPDSLYDQVKLRVECENDFGVDFSHRLT